MLKGLLYGAATVIFYNFIWSAVGFERAVISGLALLTATAFKILFDMETKDQSKNKTNDF